MEGRLLTAAEVAKRLGCSVSLVRRADMKVRLGAVRIGKRGVRYQESAVSLYVETQAFGNQGERLFPDSAKPQARKVKLTSRHGLW